MRELMFDINSEIIDFYPNDFEVDVEGKRYAWMGEVILPFIDEKRLLEAINKKIPLMTKEDLNRNKLGHPFIFINKESFAGKLI